jgi:indole-3-glycerol phosphate synthase
VLGGIVHEAEARAELLAEHEAALREAARTAPSLPSFRDALRAPSVSVIAEVKRRSPSKGTINPGLSAGAQAEAYAHGGAAAISILTEPVHFGGSGADLEEARAYVTIPLLKKDFHVQPVQLLEARALGAAAVLLIARALSPRMLPVMASAARDLGLDMLVEIRSEVELERALAIGADVIGVNSRELEFFDIVCESCWVILFFFV